MPSSACDWSSDVCSSDRSEEHTSELQSRSDLVCRLLLEKKKQTHPVPLTTKKHTCELHSHASVLHHVLHDIQAHTTALNSCSISTQRQRMQASQPDYRHC